MKQHLSYYLLVTLLLSTTLLGVGIGFGIVTLSQWKKDITRLREDIAQEQEKVKRLSTLKAGFDVVREDQEKLQRYFFQNNEDDWLRFVTGIEKLGAIAGVKSTMSAADFVPGKPFSVSLTFSGPYQNVIRYLGLVESFPAKLSLTRYMLAEDARSPSDEQSAEKPWSGSMQIELVSIKKK